MLLILPGWSSCTQKIPWLDNHKHENLMEKHDQNAGWPWQCAHLSHVVMCTDGDKSLYDDLDDDSGQVTHPSSWCGGINGHVTDLSNEFNMVCCFAWSTFLTQNIAGAIGLDILLWRCVLSMHHLVKYNVSLFTWQCIDKKTWCFTRQCTD